jgi:hypothetical protein
METLQRTANRGSISSGYDIDNSVKLEADNNEWLFRASPTEGNRRTFTFSFWIKRTGLGTVNASGVQYVAGQGQHGRMYFTNDYFGFRFDDGHDTRDITTLHRDTAAWLHVVVAVDTNQSSSSNRVKIYFNGVQTTAIDFDGGSYPDLQDQASGWFTTNYLTVGTAPFGGSYNAGDGDYDMRGYLAEFCAVDGQQLAPTDFGETNDDGIWVPIDVSGINFGSEGYYLDFADASDLGDDESGNGNDFTENNLASADQATDTPTNNFCTWNPLVTNAGVFTYTEGATKWKPSSGNWQTTTASMGFTKGKWYAEFKMDNNVTAAMVGVQQLENDKTYSGQYLGYYANTTSMGMGYYNADGKVYRNTGESAYGASYPSSVLVSVALEFKDDGTANMYVAKDGTWQNSADPANGTGGFGLNYGSAVDGFFTFASSLYQNPGYWQANFGGYTVNSISSAASDANGYGTFEYAPPSGFYALCTKNLAEYG